ncbi:MAG: type II secretion system protein [Planctomycetota bacterium]
MTDHGHDRPRRRGFTVVELIITLTVLAVAAGTLVPLMLEIADKQADLVDRAKARQFALNVVERLRAAAPLDGGDVAVIADEADGQGEPSGWDVSCDPIDTPAGEALRVDVSVTATGEAFRFRPIVLTVHLPRVDGGEQ